MLRRCIPAVVGLGTASHLRSQAPIHRAFAAGPKQTGSLKTSMKDRVVLVTGASAGIGESIAWAFAGEGSKLILIGRRKERLNTLKHDMQESYPGIKIHTVAMSVDDLDAVAALPGQLPAEFKNVDVLVNNAGKALGVYHAYDNLVSDGKEMMDTNVTGLIAFCRAFLPGMKERGFGHIFNMGSIAGHYGYSQGSMYCASKWAVKGFTEAMRCDVSNTPIRITHLSPGLVGNTEFSNIRFRAKNDDADAFAEKVYADIVALHPNDIADDVLYAATRPAHVQICEIMTMCTNQSGPKDIQRVGPKMGAP